MPTSQLMKNRLKMLQREYERLRRGKESLLKLLDEVEISEVVYNSNAIENSTLTLRETEQILLEMQVSRDVSVREVFEAKNLARVIEYVRTKAREVEISTEVILLLHQMLIGNINDQIAGRLRKEGEYVRVGAHIAPAPEHVERMLKESILEYISSNDAYFLDRISRFHLDFEMLHPFNDGNGRIGRVLINYQLERLGFPNIIIRDKEKQTYYRAFHEYQDSKSTKTMEKVLIHTLTESLHKRIAYLRGDAVITLVEYANHMQKSVSTVLNAAKKQTLPAFREKGVWKIGKKY